MLQAKASHFNQKQLSSIEDERRPTNTLHIRFFSLLSVTARAQCLVKPVVLLPPGNGATAARWRSPSRTSVSAWPNAQAIPSQQRHR
jgi:hypothetical protein